MLRLLSTSSLLIVARIVGAVAGFATQFLLARTLPMDQLGLFFFATSMAAVAGLVAALGYPGIAVRVVSRYRERERSDLLSAFIGRAGRDTLRLGLLLSLGVAAWGAVYGAGRGDAALAAILAAASIPALAWIRLQGSLAGAIRCFGLGFLPDILIRPALFLAAVAALMAFGLEPSVSLAVALLTLVTIGVALAQHLAVSRRLPEAAAPQARHSRLARTWRREALPLVVVAMFTSLFADLTILAVTPFLGKADLAAFGVCMKIALLVGFAVQLVHQITAPDIADAYSRKEVRLLRRTLLRADTLPMAYTIGATIAMAGFGDKILALFGPQFASAQAALVVLVACQALRAAFGPSVTVLTLAGEQVANASLCALSLAVLVIANAALAPGFGVLGAALAVAAAMLVWTAASAVVLYRRRGLRTDVVALLSLPAFGSAARSP